MRILYVFNWWESVVALGENLIGELAVSAVVAGFVWLSQRRRRRRLRVDRAIAARIPDRQALDGVPMRMKLAVYQRMGPATAAAAREILSSGRVSREVAALRAEKAVNNAIAWLLELYRDADRLGRWRMALEFPFLFKVCLAHQLALLERRTAPDLADLLLVR